MAAAARVAAPLAIQGEEWDTEIAEALRYRDERGELALPLPALPGLHQAQNAALAVALLRHQDRLPVSPAAIAQGLAQARWPARLQRLADGPLAGAREVWLDGGHNPGAGRMLGEHFAGRRLHLIIGMLDAKDPAALTGPLAPGLASISVVPVPGHEWHPAAAFGARAVSKPDITTALADLPADGLPVLIAGSLYLAGEVLRLNAELPD